MTYFQMEILHFWYGGMNPAQSVVCPLPPGRAPGRWDPVQDKWLQGGGMEQELFQNA